MIKLLFLNLILFTTLSLVNCGGAASTLTDPPEDANSIGSDLIEFGYSNLSVDWHVDAGSYTLGFTVTGTAPDITQISAPVMKNNVDWSKDMIKESFEYYFPGYYQWDIESGQVTPFPISSDGFERGETRNHLFALLNSADTIIGYVIVPVLRN
ncbi:MAG: hypothetical protein FWD44_09255 [Oscillospiraceae bacterium]|nr:hypothetical protein [Oscillospiraceae bacterium]